MSKEYNSRNPKIKETERKVAEERSDFFPSSEFFVRFHLPDQRFIPSAVSGFSHWT